MNFSIDWLDIGDSRSPEIAATTCSWAIELAGANITKFAWHDKDEAPERMITSCYPIADGLSRSWWYLFSSSGGSLPLKKYREGFIFPNLLLEPVENELRLSAFPFRYENPKLSFVNQSAEVLSKDEARATFGEFIEQVIRRLKLSNVASTSLTERWDWIMRSTLDDDERSFCEAAGAAGLDPYACTDQEAASIQEAAKYFSPGNLIEFLSGEHAASAFVQTRNDVQWDLDWYIGESKRIGDRALLPEMTSLSQEIRLSPEATTPYLRGYLAAQRLRKVLDVDEDENLASASSIAAKLGNKNFEYAQRPTRKLKGIVEPVGDSAKVLLPPIHREDSRAFALARGIGDFLIFGNTGPAAISDTHSARQASGRAFAAEFLAPAKVLLERKENGWSEDELAREFGVGELVVRHQLENFAEMVLAS